MPGSHNGSILLYNKFIRPYVLKYENDIDKAADEVGKFVDKGMSDSRRFVRFRLKLLYLDCYKVLSSFLPPGGSCEFV